MTPTASTPRRDRALDDVAAIAATIILAAFAALAGALLSWQTIAAKGDSGSEAAGIVLAPAGHALVIDSLGYRGRAMRAGFRIGDVVLAVDGAPVAGVAAAYRALARPVVDIRVRRGDKTIDIHLPPDRSPPLG